MLFYLDKHAHLFVMLPMFQPLYPMHFFRYLSSYYQSYSSFYRLFLSSTESQWYMAKWIKAPVKVYLIFRSLLVQSLGLGVTYYFFGRKTTFVIVSEGLFCNWCKNVSTFHCLITICFKSKLFHYVWFANCKCWLFSSNILIWILSVSTILSNHKVFFSKKFLAIKHHIYLS